MFPRRRNPGQRTPPADVDLTPVACGIEEEGTARFSVDKNT
ncbi:MAG: hypothetical protein AVDCRST_MAG70-2492 [uncultured Thermomicrobiales bacterium]|uniref:Uncharacterized protein n=1 Tax=uncultured Thermomicrobiales bacterium TaxID=1645740 RepID=A0A6J4VBI6_9BACT|nr:MAG: hypothetical protein AVDCRST_MAG70-2492 [uncultured Thermomicrobiales bacterium]